MAVNYSTWNIAAAYEDLKKDMNRQLAGSMEIPGAISDSPFARQCYTTGGGNKVETAKELRKKLKEAEKRERACRKSEKRLTAERKDAIRRRKVALNALESAAEAGQGNAVYAAKVLLELG